MFVTISFLPNNRVGMVDQALLIGEIFIAVILFIFVTSSTYLFLSKRNEYPIKAREPFKGTYAIVYSITLLSFADILVQLAGGNVQCEIPQVLKTIGANTFVLGFGSKLLGLCIAYEAEVWKKKMHLDEKTKLPISIRIRNALKGKKMFLFLSAFVAKWVLFWIAALASTPNSTSPDLLWNSPACLTIQTISGLDVLFNLLLVAFAFLAVAKNLRKVQDNNYLRDELKYVTISLLVVLIQWVIGSAFDSRIIYSPVGAIFQSQFPAFYVTFFCMFHIWLRTTKLGQRKDANTLTSKRTSVDERNDVSPNGAVSQKSNNYHKNQLERILSNSEDFEDFEKFLQREFATEELYFLQEIFLFQNELQQFSNDQANATAKKIFSKYIVESSHLCVNISGVARRELNGVFNEDKTLDKEELSKAFSKSYSEVIHLLATDKFRRYKNQSQYYQMKQAKTELQESIPVNAAMVDVPLSPSGLP
jgi:hypothetical protein